MREFPKNEIASRNKEKGVMVTVIGAVIALKFEMSYREDKLPNIFNSESFTKRAKPGMDWKFSLLYLIGMTVHLKTLA